MDESDRLHGQCLCSAVRFSVAPPLDAVTRCHCRSCRLSRGVGFVTWTSVPVERFRYDEGEANVSWYRSSPQVRWGFCKTCGASMFYVADGEGHPEAPQLGHVYLSLGNLTGPVDQAPSAHVSYEERVSWIEHFDALPKFRGKGEEPMT